LRICTGMIVLGVLLVACYVPVLLFGIERPYVERL